MSLTFPSQLNGTDGSSVAQWSSSTNRVYKQTTRHGTVSGKLIYDLWRTDTNAWVSSNDVRTIAVDTSTGAWSDHNPTSGTDPTIVVDSTSSNSDVTLTDNNNVLKFRFLDPNYSNRSYGTSGGGTSTEEVLVEDARMVFYTGTTGWRFEQRGYAAGSYQLIGGTVNESWTVSTGSNNLQHHISQIPAGGTYQLYSGSSVVATLTTNNASKKVFCNFW